MSEVEEEQIQNKSLETKIVAQQSQLPLGGKLLKKSPAMKSIEDIKVGAMDPNNLKIIGVLAKDNEFAIYEIENDNPDARMKVLIDGYSNESENEIKRRFNAVKQDYIIAKGFLANASNREVMKQRIAHTLATCLSTDPLSLKMDKKVSLSCLKMITQKLFKPSLPDSSEKKPFTSLIATLQDEHIKLARHRFYYLFPAWFAIVLCTLMCLAIYTNLLDWITPPKKHVAWVFFSTLLASLMGGGISMLISAKLINFLELSNTQYVLQGVERMFLSCLGGAVAFIAIKSGVVLTSFAGKSHWTFMVIMVLAGFSESFVPNLLDKVNGKTASESK